MDVRLHGSNGVLSRREAIIDLLHEQGEVSVSELSKLSGVSSMTIRRDLEVLEKDGVLLRVHGGAISLASRGYAPPFTVRSNHGVEAKRRIGEAAAAMLAERETVILDVGSTALAVANALQERRNLTVRTPSLHAANVLSRSPGIRLMLTGGTLAPGELSMVGDQAEEAFSRLRFDTFVMPGKGIRCVGDRPWVTAAETCECLLAYLSLGEREEISRGLSTRCSLRGIARLLGQSPSTISREVLRNGRPDRYRTLRWTPC